MASTRAAAPLRSALRIALRPAAATTTALPARASRWPAVYSRCAAAPHARGFRTFGARWERSAAAPEGEVKKWDFDMVGGLCGLCSWDGRGWC
ncbi:hypothetical protein IMZ48_17600 [Candidatus Bathyarchaeota archaeon]|nr:hypothetical protein [Candidatus Bathyarchaeota archaeon]